MAPSSAAEFSALSASAASKRMNALVSTTIVAVTAIVAATVAVGLHTIDQTAWLTIVGSFGGVTGGVHLLAGKGSS